MAWRTSRNLMSRIQLPSALRMGLPSITGTAYNHQPQKKFPGQYSVYIYSNRSRWLSAINPSLFVFTGFFFIDLFLLFTLFLLPLAWRASAMRRQYRVCANP